MARITVEDCIDKFESRFELVLVASNRARKLHSGENPTIEKDNDKNTVIALREIAEETINIDDMKDSVIQEYQTVPTHNEEDLSIEHSETESYQEEHEQDEHEEELKVEPNSISEVNLEESMTDNINNIEETQQNNNITELLNEDKD